MKGGVHFPGLNGLRFFAAMAVAVSHVELMKQYHGLPSGYDDPALYELGRLAVTLFFVLSGYLITYLLLVEKQVTGTIDVRGFYVRRMLRIWPLYFLVVLLSFLLFPRLGIMEIPKYTAAIGEHVTITLPLFLLFLPQAALSVFDPVPFAEPAWSIGVEEQFYLLWPLLLKKFRRLVPVAIVVGLLVVAARYGALFAAQASVGDPAALQFWNRAINYFYFTRMECMAIGALFAWIVFAKKRALLDFLHNRFVQAVVYAITAYLLVTDNGKPIFSYGWYSVCFGVLILNVSTNERTLIALRAPLFEFLGRISFSIYMFHEVAIQLTLKTLGASSNVVLYSVSLVLTLAMASAVYVWYERPFLRLKSRYAVIPSGDDAAVPLPVPRTA
ncbi:MAG TPA: acyltransferase [Thermoanaerobaculia bacterium]|nr:acyltransferase [Thermoanaerobaculia bacterium]